MAGIHQLGQVPAATNGHELPTLGVGGAVEADGQICRQRLVGQAPNSRGEADGADRDVAWGDGQPFVVRKDGDCRSHRLIVVQRLTHTHEDNVPQLLGGGEAGPMYLRVQDLGHNLARGQVALETHLARGTKDAAHRTSYLTADAGGVPVTIGHQHRLNQMAVGQAEEKFVGPVGAMLVLHDFRPDRRSLLRQQGVQLRTQIFHLGKRAHLFAI